MLRMWSDIWNISYIELQIWNQVSYDLRSYERNLKKSQDFNGVWTRDLVITVQRSNQLSQRSEDGPSIVRFQKLSESKAHPLLFDWS